MIFIVIVLGTLVAGVGSVLLAAALAGALSRYTQHLLSLAAGALLATALLHLMPEAIESHAGAHELFALLLGSLVFFFLLDKAELWHHGHEHGDGHGHDHNHAQAHAHAHLHDHAQAETQAQGAVGDNAATGDSADHHVSPKPKPTALGAWAVLLGDSVHAFGDGILIAAAFVADVHLGVAATLAVLAHEVPHHIGDLVVLRRASGSLRAAVAKVSAAGAVTVLGGLLGYAFSSALKDYSPYVLVVGAASFIYVALADLIPQLQQRLSSRQTAAQVAWLGMGILLVGLATRLSH